MNYRDLLKRHIMKGLVGFIAGFLFAICRSPDFGVAGAALIGLFLAGVPYGWQLSGKVVGGHLVIGHVLVMLFAFVIRVILAVFVGWVAYPIALVYYLIKIKQGPDAK